MSKYVDRATSNGGFPLPPDNEPERLVSARHDACGQQTRVRLPHAVPARAVRRVVCERCAVPYQAGEVTEDTSGSPSSRVSLLSRFPRPSRESAWRWASVPVAAALVLLALNALQGGDEPAPPAGAAGDRAAESAPPDAGRVVDVSGKSGAGAGGAPVATASKDAQLVSESTYSLALPAGWDRVAAQGGATFAAAAPGGEADATLWIERDPKLDFATFEARSLDQLEQLAGSAEVVERTTGPTPESTVIRMAADAPSNAPQYEVLLRASGDYWYYLATTVQPGAPADAIEGVEVLQGSLVPQGAAG